MSTPDPNTTALDKRACWDLLATASTGRLAVIIGGRPKIFPITYAAHRGQIVFRTAAGTKLAAIRGSAVAFEADGTDPRTQDIWSVVVEGWAQEVKTPQELAFFAELPLYPISAAPKPHFVRIEPAGVSGRMFRHVAEVPHAATS